MGSLPKLEDTSPEIGGLINSSNRIMRPGSPFVIRKTESSNEPPGKNSAQHTKSFNLRKKDLSTSGTSSTQDNVGPTTVNEMKKQYKNQMAEAAEKYLVDEIIMLTTPLEMHVAAYILWKSLLHWDAFSPEDNSTYNRIFAECERAVKNSMDSRTMLVHWLSTSMSLMCLAQQEIMQENKSDQEARLADFMTDLRGLASSIFESLCRLLQQRLEPLMTTFLAEVISALDTSKNPKVLQDIYRVCSDFTEAITQQCILEEISHQFYARVISYFTAVIVDDLVLHGGCFGKATQIKLFLTQVEDWSRQKFGQTNSTIAQEQFEPLRQAANLLVIPLKEELKVSSFRKTVCPSLRPKLVAELLRAFKPDQYAKDLPSTTLVVDIANQDLQEDQSSSLYDPLIFKALNFGSIKMVPLNLDTIALPKVVIDKSAFAFLTSPGKGLATTSSVW